jgi:hypothetical protein
MYQVQARIDYRPVKIKDDQPDLVRIELAMELDHTRMLATFARLTLILHLPSFQYIRHPL